MKKKTLGQFFTKKTSLVLRKHIVDFIAESGKTMLYDPFAGAGDLLDCDLPNITERKGLDIDEDLHWERNDSLLSIPRENDSIILTNPPYYGKSSAKRHKDEKVFRYFEGNCHTDIYQLALEKSLEASDYVVAVIPESFINSSFDKSRCVSITTIEENPFDDTDCPICVACFGKDVCDNTILYKSDERLFPLELLGDIVPAPSKRVEMKFNSLEGWLAIKCIDDIRFGYVSDFNYDFEKNIKVSSRSYTLVDIDIDECKRDELIAEANRITTNVREMSKDLLLTPFKGNRNGVRRRRLDFALARKIIEKAVETLS